MVSEEIRGMIPDFVRGMLSEAEAAEVEAALKAYPELMREYEAARRYYAVLDQLPEVKAPEGFLHQVNRGIERRPFGERVARFLFKPLALKLPLELAGVAACLIAVTVIFRPLSFLQNNLQIAWTTPNPAPAFEGARKSPAALDRKLAEPKAAAEEPAANTPAKDQLAMARATEKKAPAAQAQPFDEPARSTRALAKAAFNMPAAPLASEEIAKEKPAGSGAVQPAETHLQTATAAIPAPAPPAAAEPQPVAEAKPAEPAGTQEKNGPAGVFEAAVDIGTIDVAYAAPPAEEQKMAEEMELQSAPQAASAADGEPAKKKEKNDQFTFLEDKKAKAASPAVPAVKTHAAIDSVLVLYDSLLMVSTQGGKTAYTLTVTPKRLAALQRDLARSFRLTLHTLDFDPAQAKRVKVTIVVDQ